MVQARESALPPVDTGDEPKAGTSTEPETAPSSRKRQRKTVQQFTYASIGENGSGIKHPKKKKKKGGAKAAAGKGKPGPKGKRGRPKGAKNKTPPKKIKQQTKKSPEEEKVAKTVEKEPVKSKVAKTPASCVDLSNDFLTPRGADSASKDPKCDPKKLLVASFFNKKKSVPALTLTKAKSAPKVEPTTVMVHHLTAKKLAELKIKVLRQNRSDEREAQKA